MKKIMSTLFQVGGLSLPSLSLLTGEPLRATWMQVVQRRLKP